jgi:hypothetical protein
VSFAFWCEMQNAEAAPRAASFYSTTEGRPSLLGERGVPGRICRLEKLCRMIYSAAAECARILLRAARIPSLQAPPLVPTSGGAPFHEQTNDGGATAAGR